MAQSGDLLGTGAVVAPPPVSILDEPVPQPTIAEELRSLDATPLVPVKSNGYRSMTILLSLVVALLSATVYLLIKPPPPPAVVPQTHSKEIDLEHWKITWPMLLSVIDVLARWLEEWGLSLLIYGFLLSLKLITVAGAVKKANRSLRRLRGIKERPVFKGECQQPGSAMLQGQPKPPCQVDIYEVGFLTDTFLGHAVRLSSHLIVPRHVVEGRREIVMAANGTKYPLGEEKISSRIFPDIVYYTIPTSVWSEMKIQSARPVKKLPDTAVVTCSGKPGASTGMLKKLPIMGMYKYTGSTMNGSSGSAYMSGNLWFGIHTGVVNGTENVGSASTFLAQEIQKIESSSPIYQGESPNKEDMAEYATYGNKTVWTDLDAQDRINDLYEGGREWARDIEIDYNADVFGDWEGESADRQQPRDTVTQLQQMFANMSVVDQEVVLDLLRTNLAMKKTGLGQSKEQAAFELPESVIATRFSLLEKRLQAVETELQALKNKPNGVETSVQTDAKTMVETAVETVVVEPEMAEKSPPPEREPVNETVAVKKTVLEMELDPTLARRTCNICHAVIKKTSPRQERISMHQHRRAKHPVVRGESAQLGPRHMEGAIGHHDALPAPVAQRPFLGQRPSSRPKSSPSSSQRSRSLDGLKPHTSKGVKQLEITALAELLRQLLSKLPQGTTGPISATTPN